MRFKCRTKITVALVAFLLAISLVQTQFAIAQNTALFSLLELIDSGVAKPAAIIAMPVGFVGAAESKAELHGDRRGIPYATVLGRRGGSAMAAAAFNAITSRRS